MAIAEVTVDELRRALDEHQPLTVVDIRPSVDREWIIPGSRHVDAYADLKRGDIASLAEGAAQLPRDRPVVAVCGRGNTSLLAAKALDSFGFEAFSLRGGMTAWTSAWNTAIVVCPSHPDLDILQVRRIGKGCISYLIASRGYAAVVDPSLDAAVYSRLAANRGWRIAAVVDTHVHADHVSHAYQLGEAARAPVYLPATDRVSRPFTALGDGERVRIGDVAFAALRTPGHTRESTCLLVEDAALCTGDTLFLTSVGRPDLEASGEESRARAHLLYQSLAGRVLGLADSLIVLPGHASVPLAFDGEAHAATLATVRTAVSLTNLKEEAFVDAVLARIPAAPPNHHRIVRINEGKEPWPGDMRQLEAGANRCAVSA